MENIISIKFEGDNSLEEKEKINYIRYINRILTDEKNEIIIANGFVRIISEKGHTSAINFISNNETLNRKIGLKLSDSPFQL